MHLPSGARFVRASSPGSPPAQRVRCDDGTPCRPDRQAELLGRVPHAVGFGLFVPGCGGGVTGRRGGTRRLDRGAAQGGQSLSVFCGAAPGHADPPCQHDPAVALAGRRDHRGGLTRSRRQRTHATRIADGIWPCGLVRCLQLRHLLLDGADVRGPGSGAPRVSVPVQG